MFPVSTVPAALSMDWPIHQFLLAGFFLVIGLRGSRSAIEIPRCHVCKRHTYTYVRSPVNLVGSVRTNISSPFLMNGTVVSSKNDETSSTGITPCLKRLCVIVGMLLLVVGNRELTVRSMGPRPSRPLGTHGPPRNNKTIGDRHRIRVLYT